MNITRFHSSKVKPSKTVLAIAFVIAFASIAIAAQSGSARGGNNANPSASDGTAIDTRINSADEIRTREVRYNEIARNAADNYNTAFTHCKTLEINDRGACRREARLAREQTLAAARTQRKQASDERQEMRTGTLLGEQASASTRP